MSIDLISDPIMPSADFQDLLGETNPTQIKVLLNGLSGKFMRFTNRVQINYDGTNAITESVRVHSMDRQFLHASPVVADETHDIEVALIEVGETVATYKYSDGEIAVYSTDLDAWIELVNSSWPHPQGRTVLQITYFGGFSTVPGDVVQGAIMQGRVDLNRLKGEAGVGSRSYGGESTTFEKEDVIQAVRDLWVPYRIRI